MGNILKQLRNGCFHEFSSLFDLQYGVPLLVVNFIALLELVKEGLIVFTQSEAYAPIYVCLSSAEQCEREPACA